MAEEKLLTVREVSLILGVSEKEVMDFAETGTIPAYKVGGVFLRFKKEQVYSYQKKMQPQAYKNAAAPSYGIAERFSDFFYFNDFYIISLLIIGLLLVVILRVQ